MNILYIYISIYLYIYIYISLQIVNIWHYIHPHHRYDIQEVKIVLAKQLPFSFALVIMELVHIPSGSVVSLYCMSVSLRLVPWHGYEKVPPYVLELKAERQSHQRWGHRMLTHIQPDVMTAGNGKRRRQVDGQDMLLSWVIILQDAGDIKKMALAVNCCPREINCDTDAVFCSRGLSGVCQCARLFLFIFTAATFKWNIFTMYHYSYFLPARSIKEHLPKLYSKEKNIISWHEACLTTCWAKSKLEWKKWHQFFII